MLAIYPIRVRDACTLALKMPRNGCGLAKQPAQVERLVHRLKQWRAVATRYEKRAASYRAVVVIAALMCWLPRSGRAATAPC